MKLKKLVIHNIASIIDAEVNFDQPPLSSDPLFLITGDTGTGKTTILNAICLALYNQVPSLESMGTNEKDPRDNIKTKDPVQLMRRGTGEAWVELTFIGNDERHYKSSWRIHRARNKATGALQSLERTLQREDEDNIEHRSKEIDQRIKDAVGLTFDQFTRTTLLAQGQFSTFMKAKEGDKSEILEKLTGTEIYTRIGKVVNDLFQKKKREYEVLDQVIKEARLLNDEEKDQCQAVINQANAQLEELKPKLDTIDRHIGLLTQRNTSQEAINGYLRNLASISTNPLRDGVCWMEMHLKNLQDSLNEIDIELEKQVPYLSIFNNAQRIDQQAKSIQDALKNASSHEKKRQKLISDTEASKKAEEPCREAYEKADKEFQSQNAECIKTQEEAQKFDLTALQTAYNKTNEDAERYKSAHDALVAFDKAKEAFDKAQKQLEEAKGLLSTYQEQLSSKKTSLPDLQNQYQYLEGIWQGQKDIHDHISELRNLFAASEACPLCGTKGVHLHTDERINTMLKKAEDEKNEAKSTLEKLCQEISGLEANIKVQKRYLGTLQKDYDKKANDLTQAEKRAKELYPNYNSPEALAQIEELMQQSNAMKDQRNQSLIAATYAINYAQKAQKLTESLRSTKDKALQKLDSQRENTRNLIHRADTEAQLKEASENGAQASLTEMKSLTQAWKNSPSLETVADVAREIMQAATAYQNLEKQREKLVAQCKDVAQQLSTCRYDLQALKPYEDSSYQPKPVEIYDLNTKIRELGMAINKAEGLLDAEKKKLDEIESKIKNEISDDTTLDSLTESKQIAEKAKDEAISLRAKAEEKLTHNADAEKEHLQKLEQLGKLTEEKNNWQLLNDAFGTADGKKFRNIAQSYVLRALLSKANYYLRMLSNRYELDCEDGSLTINVIDSHQDNAIRNVGLLSGGESFIVSLALALGLSAISKDQIQVDTLFIDEGFGTLDADTLETVINTLDRLHSIGGRRIGIISHVAELKERIPTQIRLKRSGPSSSRIEIV